MVEAAQTAVRNHKIPIPMLPKRLMQKKGLTCKPIGNISDTIPVLTLGHILHQFSFLKAIVAGIAASVLVLFAGTGYVYYRRRMRLIQERVTKNKKMTNIRVGVSSMAFIVDTGSTIVWICLEILEVVFDWLTFVNLPEGAGVSKFVYVAVVYVKYLI